MTAVSRWSFPKQAAAAALCVGVLGYLPVFAGRVPLPTDLLGYFPLWQGVVAAPAGAPHHAEVGDLITLMYPWRSVLRTALRAGELPYWDPSAFLGAPFVANPISAVFYPPNWIYALLPLSVAWSLLFPARIGLAALFASLFARRIGASRAGALLAGIVFSLSGFLTGWQGWPQADCALWAPLVLLGITALRRRPTPRRAALLGAAMAMPILAGHPEVGLYVLALAAAWAAYVFGAAWRCGRNANWARRYAGALLLAAGLAGGLSAAQILPSAEWLGRITRTTHRLWVPRPTRDLVSLVSRDANANPNAIGLLIPEECAYVGIGTLLLSALAFLPRRSRGAAVFLASSGFLAASIAFGLFPFSNLFRATPILQSFPGNRLIWLLDFSLAMLAGLGLSALPRILRSRWHRGPAYVAIAAAAAAVAFGVRAAQARVTPVATIDPWTAPSSSAVLLALSAAGLIAILRAPRLLRIGSAVVAVLVVLDLATFANAHVPLVRPETVFPETEAITFLQDRTPPGQRVLVLDSTAPRGAMMLYGLTVPDGYPQVLRETARFLSPLNGGNETDEPLRPFRLEGVLGASRGLVDLTGVRYLVSNRYAQTDESLSELGKHFPPRLSSGAVLIFENPSAVAPAWLVPASSVRSVIDATRAEDRVRAPDFDPRREVVLEKPMAGDAALPWEGEVVDLEQGRGLARGRLRASAPAVLILAQTFYPGWRAFVDGRPAELLRADSYYCAVAVPAGEHRFAFEFRPTRKAAGLATSLVSLAAVLLLAASGSSPGGIRRGGLR